MCVSKKAASISFRLKLLVLCNCSNKWPRLQVDKGLQWGNIKQKVIQADLRIFTHIPAYSDISRHIQPDIIRHVQAYSGPCVTLTNSEPWQIQNQTRTQNLGIFRTLAYSEPVAYSWPWYIQNPDIFRTQVCSEPRSILRK